MTLHVPAVSCAKIAAAAGDAETAFGAARGKAAIGSADRAAFAERDLVGFLLRRGLRLRFSGRGRLLRLILEFLP